MSIFNNSDLNYNYDGNGVDINNFEDPDYSITEKIDTSGRNNMKHKTLFTNPFLNKETLEFAPVIGQRVHCTCVHCNKNMVIPVPNEYVDWEDVANLYKRRGEQLVKNFDRIVKDIDVMYQDNPIREYLLNEWKAIFNDFNKD